MSIFRGRSKPVVLLQCDSPGCHAALIGHPGQSAGALRRAAERQGWLCAPDGKPNSHDHCPPDKRAALERGQEETRGNG